LNYKDNKPNGKIRCGDYDGRRIELCFKCRKNIQDAPKKIRTYMEEEIFEIIDKFDFDERHNIAKEGFNQETTEEMDKRLKKELKRKFMTPQGFRRSIERLGLVGTKFDKDTNSVPLECCDEYELCKCGHIKFEHEEKGNPTRCMYGNSFSCKCEKFREDTLCKIKCNSCLKQKQEYVSGLCKECSDKMDNHIVKNTPDAPGEFTKIISMKCNDCDKICRVLCNETAKIISLRCPECVEIFDKAFDSNIAEDTKSVLGKDLCVYSCPYCDDWQLLDYVSLENEYTCKKCKNWFKPKQIIEDRQDAPKKIVQFSKGLPPQYTNCNLCGEIMAKHDEFGFCPDIKMGRFVPQEKKRRR